MKLFMIGLTVWVILAAVCLIDFDMTRREQFNNLKNECRENDYVMRKHFDVNDEDLINLRRDIGNLRNDLDGYRFKRMEQKNERN